MKIIYAFLTRYSEAHPDGTYTAIGADFENIQSDTLPFVLPISIVAKFDSEGYTGEKLLVQVSCEEPGGLVSPPIQIMLDHQKAGIENFPLSKTARIVLNIGHFVFNTPGSYNFSLSFGEAPESDTALLNLNILGAK